MGGKLCGRELDTVVPLPGDVRGRTPDVLALFWTVGETGDTSAMFPVQSVVVKAKYITFAL